MFVCDLPTSSEEKPIIHICGLNTKEPFTLGWVVNPEI